MARRPEYAGKWPRIRKKILERDGHVCQIQGPNCTQHATHVDHIVPVSEGGAWWDESNLRAACAKCNLGRVNHTGSDRWTRAKTRITLVMGPPGAGKTTYVEVHKHDGDLVVDYDRIAEALGSEVSHDHGDEIHGAVMAARNAVLNSLRQGKTDARHAWIISANPNAEAVFPHHSTVVVDPGIDEVLARVHAAGRPDRWIDLVHDWYAQRSGTTRNVVASSRDWFAGSRRPPGAGVATEN
jgi:hypothetical protein